MFETTSKLAEKAATSVSRRRFLGSLGRFAGAAALAVAGTLAFGGKAQGHQAAAKGGKRCGNIYCPPGAKCCHSFLKGYYCC